MGEMADMILDQVFDDFFGDEDDLGDQGWDAIYTRIHKPLSKDKWMMKDGTVMKLCDMTELHLANSIAMCERIKSFGRLVVLLEEKARRNKVKK